MFLYAVLVMENLLSQPNNGMLLREVDESNFPKGLEEA